MLSSVFAQRKKFQKRLNHLTQRSQPKRARSPPSPASFASPEPFDAARLYADAARVTLQSDESRAGSSEQVVAAPGAQRKRMSSPQVELDFGLGEDSSLSDWLDFTHFRTESEPMLRPERNVSLGATSNVSSTKLWGSSSGSILANGSSVAIGSVFGHPESLRAARQSVRQSMPLSAAPSEEGDEGDEDETQHGGEGFNFGEDEVIVIGAPRGRDVCFSLISVLSPCC